MMGTQDLQQEHLNGLWWTLITRFNVEELRTLCFTLGIKYDSLPGEGQEGKSRELIGYLDRRNCVSNLVVQGKQLRPDIPWDSILASRKTVPRTQFFEIHRGNGLTAITKKESDEFLFLTILLYVLTLLLALLKTE